MMFNYILNLFKSIDPSFKKLMKKGIDFCILILIFSSALFVTYDFIYKSPKLFDIAIAVFEIGLTYIIFFAICSIAFTKIKEDLYGDGD